jgi:hypothetical protein
MSSTAALFIVVEGKETDPWFYDAIAGSSDQLVNHGYYIYRVEYAIGGTGNTGGGKAQVLELYRHLRRHDSLTVSSRSGGHKTVMFVIDADHDRLTGKMIKSKHITYTRLPDAEAHLFDSCNMLKVIQVLSSGTTAESAQILGWLGDWRDRLATLWREWFEVCLVGYFAGVSGPRIGTKSYVHQNYFGSTDHEKLENLRLSIKQRCVDPQRFDDACDNARRRVSDAFAAGGGKQLLKGKWLASYLRSMLNEYAKMHGTAQTKDDGSVLVAVKACASFSTTWTSYYRRRFEALVSDSYPAN